MYGATTASTYGYRGFHTCVCGVYSDNRDHLLPNERVTNSLAVHYVAYHRDEVPDAELVKIDQIFNELFPNFDYEAFDQDTEWQRKLAAAILVN